jgi:hypothetical protein
MGVEIKLDLDPEKLNREIADMIINSTVGQHMRGELERQIKSMTQPYGGLNKVVEEEIAKMIRALIQEKYRDKLLEALKQRLDGDFDKLFNGFWEKVLQRWI